jgi:hypothetical protein
MTCCMKCQRRRGALFYLSVTNVLCSSCFQAERKTKQHLIKELPEIKTMEAPLGYMNVAGEISLNKKDGQLWAEHFFKKPPVGVEN